jgi:predicted ATPase
MRAAAPLDRLVGREREIERVREALVRRRLVTLHGPGGVGKTRLAREIAACSDPSAFCEVADVHTIDELCRALAAALGDSGASSDPVARLADVLAGAGALTLVLDNVDPIAASIGDAIRQWLERAPELRILATSREPIGLAGEAIVEVPPLSLPEPGRPAAESEAVQLLAERLRDLDHRGAADGELAAIAIALEGLPLALELAAPRVAALGAERLLVRLSARLDVLTAAGTERRSLRAAIDASWQLLDEVERRALVQLSVFRGGIDVEAAEAVVETDDPHRRALDVIEALLRKSLVRSAEVPGRFDLLVTIREYAEARSAGDGAARAAARRHAEHFAARAEPRAARLGGPDRASAAAWLRGEFHNLVQAARQGPPDPARRCAAALAPLVEIEGPSDAYRALLEDLAQRHPPDSTPSAVAFLLALADQRRKGARPDARAAAEQALALAASLGDAELEGRAHAILAKTALVQGDLAAALESSDRAVLELRGTAHELLALSVRAGVLSNAERREEARVAVLRALDAAVAARNVVEEIRLLATLGAVDIDEGRPDDAEIALARLRAAIARDEATGAPMRLYAAGLAAMIAQRRGMLEIAAEEYQRAVEESAKRGFRWLAGTYRGYCGIVLGELGRDAEARAELLAAALSAREAGDRRYEAYFEAAVATLDAIAGRADEAAMHVAKCARSEGPFGAAVEVMRAGVELRSGAPDALARANERLDVVRDRFVDSSGRVRSLEVFVALRMLDLEPRPRVPAAGKLAIGRAGEWFAVGEAKRVSLAERRLLMRLLDRLARARADAPRETVTAEQLLAAGWPGERMLPEAAANRLRVAMSRLRAAGLADILESVGGGYRLSPSVTLDRGDR